MTVIRKCNGKAYKETALKQSLWEKKREEIKKKENERDKQRLQWNFPSFFIDRD